MNFAFILVNLHFILVTVEGQVSLLSKYKDICEKVNIDLLLKNQHFISQQIDCLLDKNTCTRDGLLIREIIPEILETSCRNCTEKQKQIVRKAMIFLYTNRRDDFEKILDLYDPEMRYRESIVNFMSIYR